MPPDNAYWDRYQRPIARLNAPTGAWCPLTSGLVEGVSSPNRLNAPTGAWCPLTDHPITFDGRSSKVSMHLQVRGAP